MEAGRSVLKLSECLVEGGGLVFWGVFNHYGSESMVGYLTFVSNAEVG